MWNHVYISAVVTHRQLQSDSINIVSNIIMSAEVVNASVHSSECIIHDDAEDKTIRLANGYIRLFKECFILLWFAMFLLSVAQPTLGRTNKQARAWSRIYLPE